MSRDRPKCEEKGEIHVLDRLEDVPQPTPDGDFVVIDVIISSTSIVRLLEAGAAYVKPFADIDAALEFGESAADPLLVGEQNGGPIEGFDCGPLPSVLDGETVADRPVAVLTSNGTRAVERIGHSREIFVASTVNAAAVAAVLTERDREAWLVAAGRQGEPTPEDSAGAELLERYYTDALTETARAALAEQISSSGTATWLGNLGFEHEIEALLEFGSSETVPRLRDGVFVAD